MPAPVQFVLLVLAGLALGILFYGGLWLTVRALPASHHPTALMIGSYWGRTAVTIAGLLWAMDGSWQRAVVSMGGFLLARVILSPWVPGPKPVRKRVV